MLADVSLLLHEINDAVRARRAVRDDDASDDRRRDIPARVRVTGLASAGKARLVSALHERLALEEIAVESGVGPAPSGDATLRVHAETDIEALIEGGITTASRQDARNADVIVPVDWEPVERSVRRVMEMLADRGAELSTEEAGV